MSSKYAIEVSGLSKCYEIYDKPSHRLKQMLMRGKKQYYKEFWALRDVSFKIEKGDTVGIIGRNGSGKSTLLQMICGTLNPTNGAIQTNGRIAALLELGSGFNPEFTGRENVYLNASVLGLSKAATDARFDEIESFADIGDFIDQPVKTYSSGMMVRLAFAVTVHVDADILVVDEALAVGDAFFTQKCMVQIKKLMNSGVTLLFVSHDSNAVKSLCSSALLLDDGQLTCAGDTNSVVEKYYGSAIGRQQATSKSTILPTRSTELQTIGMRSFIECAPFQSRAMFHRLQNGKADFINVQLLDDSGHEIQEALFCQPVILRMSIQTNFVLQSIGLAYHIRDKNGFDLIYSDTKINHCPIENTKAKDQYIVDWQFNLALHEGDYTIAAMLSIPLDLNVGHVEVCDFVPIAVQVRVGRGNAPPIYGAVYLENTVTCQQLSADDLSPNLTEAQ